METGSEDLWEIEFQRYLMVADMNKVVPASLLSVLCNINHSCESFITRLKIEKEFLSS
jgi:hypothetical protein